MNLNDLIAKGYFSEEMPPPFNTILLGKHCTRLILFKSTLAKRELEKIKETQPVNFSTPKQGISRRLINIPNPVHQIMLSELIERHWLEIRKLFKTSLLSASTPTFSKKDKRAVVQISKFNSFKEKCIELSFNKTYELKADISRYFPSIYTHSIPWAIHTKKLAKLQSNRRSRSLFGNLLDESLRFGQSGQTIGIPVGTDTSRIVAELVGCAIDNELLEGLQNEKIEVVGCRFIDDYQLYFDSQSDAEKSLKILQKILNGYSLDLNEEKTKITSAPYSIENDWTYQLNSCPIRTNDQSLQKHDLINYVNLLISLSLKNRKDAVIKYGIKKLIKLVIFPENWNLYESLIFKLGLAEPAVLPYILVFLLQNQSSFSKTKLKLFISSIINQCTYKGHNFEIAWVLWIAKSFGLKISYLEAQEIIDSKDVISILILLDLHSNDLITNKRRLSINDLKLDFNSDGLMSELWLLVYEASYKGWIKSSVLESSDFFKELKRLKVSFYDSSRQIEYGSSNHKTQFEREKAKASMSFRGKLLKTSKKKKTKVPSDY